MRGAAGEASVSSYPGQRRMGVEPSHDHAGGRASILSIVLACPQVSTATAIGHRPGSWACSPGWAPRSAARQLTRWCRRSVRTAARELRTSLSTEVVSSFEDDACAYFGRMDIAIITDTSQRN